MGIYVDSVIGESEQILHTANISMVSYWDVCLYAGLFIFVGVAILLNQKPFVGLTALAIGCILSLTPIIAKYTTELVITNRRIIAKFGFISRHTVELNISKIESIRVEQGLIGRMLDYGDIIVVGTGGSNAPIPRISYPLEFRRRYDEILSSHESSKS